MRPILRQIILKPSAAKAVDTTIQMMHHLLSEVIPSTSSLLSRRLKSFPQNVILLMKSFVAEFYKSLRTK